MKKILIPIDSSEYSEKAIEQGKAMAEAFDSNVLLLYVLGIKPVPYRYRSTIPHPLRHDPMTEAEQKQAEEMLEDYKTMFVGMTEKVEIMVKHGSVADEIIKVINETDVDFVIMGSHGLGSVLYRNLVGSVTNKVLHYAEKPILVIK